MDVATCDYAEGEAVVVSVRPEFVFPFTEGMRTRITQTIYMGNYWRIIGIAASEDPVEFDVPVAEGKLYHEGQEVYLMVNPKAAVVYQRPREGIAEAVKLE